jgi:hypothetical protein
LVVDLKYRCSENTSKERRQDHAARGGTLLRSGPDLFVHHHGHFL